MLNQAVHYASNLTTILWFSAIYAIFGFISNVLVSVRILPIRIGCVPSVAHIQYDMRGNVDSEDLLASDGDNFHSPMNASTMAIDEVGTVVEDKSPGTISKSSTKNRKNFDMKLRRLEEERKVNMLFIEQKYAIMSTYNDSDEFDDDANSECKQTQKYAEHEITERKMDNVRGEGMNRVNNIARDRVFARPNTMLPNREIMNMNDSPLTQGQVYARQIIPRELPVFSGRPEEWPLFISSYENSTRLCGFGNDENLQRLQRAIKGKALEYVSSKLTLPALVPEVISTLRMLFGRPENIIHNLLSKLRAGPTVNANKLDTLVHFSLDVKNIVATMEAADLNAHLCNPMLIMEFIERLPPQMRLDWAVHSRGLKVVNLTEFSNWFNNLAEAASSVINILGSGTQDSEKRRPPRVNVHEERIDNEVTSGKRSSESKCFGCDGIGHFIAQCEKFRQFDYNEKWSVVHDKNLCRSCLKVHDPRFCRERRECAVNGCSAKHHPLLHKPEVINIDNGNRSTVAVHQMMTSNVLYRIVPITIYGEKSSIDEYAFLDEGSGPTLIEKAVLDELDIKGTQSELCLKWTDGSVRIQKDSERTDLKISPPGKHERSYLLKDVRSVAKLDLPRQTLVFSELTDKYKHLRGLPVKSYRDVVPRIIIGLNNIKVALPLKSKEGGANEPAALKTRLGWTIYGTMGPETVVSTYVNSNSCLQLHICECDDDIALHKLMERNVQIECEGANDKKPFTDDDMIQNYVVRTDDKFTVKLLWKSNDLVMPDNYEMALRRLICFERKLEKDHNLKIRVSDHICNMISKGYIRKLDDTERKTPYPRKWYLPIFVVKNPNKPDKMRIVWDAAAEHHGVSLNSCLNKGPDFMMPLMDVLFNFRVGKIGISGDISEMFHRVSVDKEDVQSQRFLWRSCDAKREPEVFVLQVMSFGASCSPALAQYVKNKNAKDFQEELPRAAKSIIERHYVDDLLDSVDSVEEAIQLAQQVRDIHKRGNFHIRNWMSNSKEVVAAMGDQSLTQSFCQAGNKVEQVVEPEKVLGMWWRTSDDAFTYNLKYTKATEEILSGKRLPTKRELLRLLMSIFDPLGLLSFYTVHMKILWQKVWRKGTEWDDTISNEFFEDWLRWLSILKDVEHINIPRCYFQMGSSRKSRVQLHVFVDASESAYAALAYFRIQTEDGIEISLVASKTKVAPLRPISIPRLELLAAVLGARLATSIINGHDLQTESTHFWTDSKTVLTWLKSDPRRYKQFVMFRVAEIQEITDVSKWRYVPSRINVADLATKWAKQPSFISTNPWFTGPSFLYLSSNEWPKNEVKDDNSNTGIDFPEGQHVAVQVEQNTPLIDYTRFSKYERLLRCMAYVKRFIDCRLLSKCAKDEINLSSEQLQWSRQYLVGLIQSTTYAEEITILQNDPSGILPKTSELRKLSPFLDGNKILRLRGRLENATIITDETKNPIILPRNHYITFLLVDWYHRKYVHVHHETVINEIFREFHITGLRSLLRTVRRSCTFCAIRRAQPEPPEMAPLPPARMSAFTKPFSHVGVDFFGPFLVTIGRRSEKRYGAVFTCLTIRAVHIEMVYSLDMNSCVMAIRNFIARRGIPLHMYSDNGTNLKAAEKELREAYKNIDFKSLRDEFTGPDMEWSFIPPASPHMGGAWERMVRSIKTVLYQIVSPDQKLNDERLHNLFLEVENIVNSRPLTYLSLETADQEALTPNHFLLGSSSGNKPLGRFDESDRYLRRSWRHSQLLADQFWKRWVAEVLPTMTRRTKWFDKVDPIKVDDIVIIVDPNSPRHCPGPDMEWSFIPPASPHMGGAWERMVRSIKTVLYQIVSPDQKLNDERLHNLFLEVENIVNSRPLTYLSLETADQEALTPNHFLLGSSSGNKPLGRFDESDRYLRRSWRHSQLLADQFWKRWVAEVLPTLTRRTKWFDKVDPIKVDDIVIIVDPNSPRHCWPKGIVTKTLIAKDGQVRSAIVRTTNGVYHRPAAKIAVIDIKRVP